MVKKYETLDEYLDDLDKIKERAAAEVEGMPLHNRIAHINQSRKRLEQKLKKLQQRRTSKRRATATKR
ncbi:MAG TPA: hypothetical protein VKI65_07880 [Gemmataceae bacterium]|nr:hypothetical protein [Gemmataceae bacterium]